MIMKINRRDFIRKTSKVLPILVLPSIIRCTAKDTVVLDCNGGCTNSCAYRCNGTCAVACGGTCLYSSKCDHCSETCTGSCVGTCWNSCQSSSEGNDTIQFKW